MDEQQDLQLKLVSQQEQADASEDGAGHHHHHGSYDGHHHHSYSGEHHHHSYSGEHHHHSSSGEHHHHHHGDRSSGEHRHHHSSDDSDGHRHHHSDRSSDRSYRRGDDEARRDGTSHSGRHRRRVYQDYGSVVLGDLDRLMEAPEQKDAPAEPTTASQGQLQREFMDKYSTALNRNYRRSRSVELWKILLIALAVLVVAAAAFAVISLVNSNPTEGKEPTYHSEEALTPVPEWYQDP